MTNKRSLIWLYFSIIDHEKQFCKCEICKQQLSYKHSVSNLKKHFKRKHPSVNIFPENSNPGNNYCHSTSTSSSNNPNRILCYHFTHVPQRHSPQPLPARQTKYQLSQCLWCFGLSALCTRTRRLVSLSSTILCLVQISFVVSVVSSTNPRR